MSATSYPACDETSKTDIEVRTLTHAVYSGRWGGLVPDALIALSRLLATLHDGDGGVAVAGLHAGPAADVEYPSRVCEPSPARPQAFSGSGVGPRSNGCGPSPASP